MAEVVLKDLYKSFGNTEVVKGVNLTVNDGEFMVFVGPSGCGKSTTLRMIAGLETVSSGNIHIADREVTRMQPKDRNVAMVFQNYALYAHKNVYNNLAFGLKVRKLPAAEIDQRVNDAAAMLGISELLERKPKQLSGGQMQRVALGRALVRNPDVFLLDEPLSNLDAKMRVRMREEIARLHAKTATSMVYVTHDQVEAMTLGNRIAVMNDGLIQQIGPPLEIYDSPCNLFVANFIGSPEMNLFDGEIVDSDTGPLFKSDDISVAVAIDNYDGLESGRPVVLGIRPEYLEPTSSSSNCIDAEVLLVEQMGSQSIILCSAGDTKFRSVLDRNDQIRVGANIQFDFDPNRVHFFDPGSGTAISKTRQATSRAVNQ
jgi:multiple sugar transport system ATP-binding protein